MTEDRAIIEFPCSSSRFFPPLNPASWRTTSASSSTTWPPPSAPEQRAYSGECHPSLDVFETDERRRDRRGRGGRASPKPCACCFVATC